MPHNGTSLMFQRRHYEAFARLLQEATPASIVSALDHARLMQQDLLIHKFAAMFERDNPRFNVARFVAACKPGANVKARPQS